MINKYFRHLELRNTFFEKKNGVETVKPKLSMDTLSDNVDNTKSCQRKRFILQFAAEKNSSPDRKDIYIIKEDKNLLAFISLILIQYIQKIIFLKKVCLRFGFTCQVSVNKNEQQWTKMFVSFLATFHLKDFREKWKRCGLYILINKHQRYWCLEFTILKRTWPIFAETLINFSQEFRPKPFVYVPHKWLWSKILTNSFLWIYKN